MEVATSIIPPIKMQMILHQQVQKHTLSCYNQFIVVNQKILMIHT